MSTIKLNFFWLKSEPRRFRRAFIYAAEIFFWPAEPLFMRLSIEKKVRISPTLKKIVACCYCGATNAPMQKKAYAKFSISLQTSQLEFLKKMSGQQFNRPISQLIAEAVNAMQKREMKKSKAAK